MMAPPFHAPRDGQGLLDHPFLPQALSLRRFQARLRGDDAGGAHHQKQRQGAAGAPDAAEGL